MVTARDLQTPLESEGPPVFERQEGLGISRALPTSKANDASEPFVCEHHQLDDRSGGRGTRPGGT